ncbi:MAG: DUF1294 domain-containing protein [Firmicutes bacterium]|nr:DUF1294 domain-containing protein [Bacillota bacterium]
MSFEFIVIVYLAVINLTAFVIYGSDKKRAAAGRWRISEGTLLGIALIGGSVGALAGMKCFRHKTRHWKFRILVPLFLLFHLAVVLMLVNSNLL